MDKKKQSILKQEARIPLQEMGLPDFPDDDTGTVTVTKSRRVSFGANFVKEFIVGSSISTQFYSEYEQAFSSSDSSNPNSSHSGLLNQSSCHDNAINLCVKPAVEDEFMQVQKKLCLEKQQNSLNNVNERFNDGNWEFNVSNNSNIFAEKSNIMNKSEIPKHITKDIKKPSHNDSFVSGEKYFQSKQGESELNSKMNDNLEKKSKPGKFSSTICFSVDSPTADMEFTEGCISLAKSIFDKKNKEMTVYIQEKKGNDKKESKKNSSDVIFDNSEVEMSLTKCVNDQSEDDSFLGNKLNGLECPSSGIQSSGSDELCENIENIPIHMYPLNVLLNQNNKSEEDSELERSLFFPERSLTEMLNPEPSKVSGFIDESLEKDNNEECNMELSICEPLKIYTSNDLSSGKNNEECNAELPNSQPPKIFLSSSDSSVEKNDEKCNVKLFSSEGLKTLVSHDLSPDRANNRESDVELSICKRLKTTVPSNPVIGKDKYEESDMELSICEPLNQPSFNNSRLEKDNNGESDMELSICEPLAPVCDSPTLKKHSSREDDMILSPELMKTPISNHTLPEKEYTKECNLELSISGTLKTAASNDCGQEKSNSEDYNVDLSPFKHQRMTSYNNLSLGEDSNEECKMKLPDSEPLKIIPSGHRSLDNDEECIIQLSTSEPLEVLVPHHLSLNNENNEECNMELSISEPVQMRTSSTPPQDNGNSEECSMELPTSQSSEMLVSTDSARDSDNMEEGRTSVSPCGDFKISASNDLSVDSENIKGFNMELSTSEPSKIFTHENPNNKCNGGDFKAETVDAVEDTRQDKKSEGEKSLEENKYLRCSFMHVDMELMEDNNKVPEGETCPTDPLSVSACQDDSLNEDKNENFDVEMMDGSSLRIFAYDRSLRKETDEKEEHDEVINCSKDSSFSEVMKEAVEEVNNGSFIKKSVIDLFRSTVTDTDVSLNENYNPNKTLSSLKMPFSLESPVKKSQEDKSPKIKKIPDDPRKMDSVSEGDKKIIALLKEQAQETNCLWKVGSFSLNGDSRCWSFSSSLLGNLVIMKFRLTPPKDMSVVSFSFIADRNIEMVKPKEFQSEKNKTAVEYAFEKMKNYFDPESRSLDNVHKIPLFLDRMNYFLARINKVVDQLLRIMKEYPGSRMKKSILSFRLYSFPLMFSLSVMVDVNDPLQLSESCVTFEKHFGNFSTTHIKSVFNDCLKSEEVLIQFIRRSLQLIISEERVLGCITNRSHIRLIT